MALVLNEEQRMLKDSASEFLKEHAPVEALRKLRDEKDATGFSQELWQQIVELGWTAIAIPESYGGLDFGFQGLGVIFQEMGHTLTASPLFSSIVLGASTIELLGSDEQKEQYLPQIASGEVSYALALEETNRHAPYHIACTAKASGNDFIINGAKYNIIF